MDTALSHREERWGLAIALGLHLLLMAALLIQPARREVLDIPERMTVSLTEDVGLEATAPDPVAESRAAWLEVRRSGPLTSWLEDAGAG